jgi:hypothetical protein
MRRDVLTRAERRQMSIRHEQYKWERMTPEQRDAAIMRAMDEALTARGAVTDQDLLQAGVPREAIDRRFRALLPTVIAARSQPLPVMGHAGD